MKKFNLDAALNGEPVKLANGNKAIVYYRIPDEYVFEDGKQPAFPLHGLILDSEGYIELADVCWRDNGTYTHYPHNYDIIGMWEEPKISIEDLPKPFNPNYKETYFYICGFNVYKVKQFFPHARFDSNNAKYGQCFRTAEDAQKWLDFMKSMME